jgi:hypothetical protein
MRSTVRLGRAPRQSPALIELYALWELGLKTGREGHLGTRTASC